MAMNHPFPPLLETHPWRLKRKKQRENYSWATSFSDEIRRLKYQTIITRILDGQSFRCCWLAFKIFVRKTRVRFLSLWTSQFLYVSRSGKWFCPMMGRVAKWWPKRGGTFYSWSYWDQGKGMGLWEGTSVFGDWILFTPLMMSRWCKV